MCGLAFHLLTKQDEYFQKTVLKTHPAVGEQLLLQLLPLSGGLWPLRSYKFEHCGRNLKLKKYYNLNLRLVW